MVTLLTEAMMWIDSILPLVATTPLAITPMAMVAPTTSGRIARNPLVDTLAMVSMWKTKKVRKIT